MFYQVKTFTSQVKLPLGGCFRDQNDIEYVVLIIEPVKLNRENWYVYQVMERV